MLRTSFLVLLVTTENVVVVALTNLVLWQIDKITFSELQDNTVGGALTKMDIVVGNEIRDSSSNLVRECLNLTSC